LKQTVKKVLDLYGRIDEYKKGYQLREIGWEDVDWIGQRPVAGSCENGNESSGSIKCGEFLD
jgi:hypothetical protein